MTVLNTDMHLVNFLFTVFECVILFFVTIYWLSGPHDKARMRYMILLILLIQYNIFSGIFPDTKISLPSNIQNILAYFGGFSVATYFVYYIYRTLELKRLRAIAIFGGIWGLFLPFIFAFVLLYTVSGDLDLSRKAVVVIPFGFSLLYVYTLTKVLWPRFKKLKPGIESEETLGLYISVLLWANLPIIVYFDGSQLLEHSVTNTGFMIMSIVYVRSSIFKSRRDYEELKLSKVLLEKTNETLQQKVEERTRELELANEKRVNSFINLMHETKTPLTLITNCLESLMLKYGESEEGNITKINLSKLNRNMGNLFDMKKLEKGIHIYDHGKTTDLTNLVNTTIRSFHTWSKNKEISISGEIEDDVLIKADPVALNRIADNLLENAVKYSDPGGKIDIVLRKEKQNIRLAVHDTGIGISQEHQEKIFEPYYQVDRKKRNVQGIGMGLSLVKRTVESLQGKIELTSEIGNGTKVEVNLPASEIDKSDVEVSSGTVIELIDREFNYEVGDIIFNGNLKDILIIEDQLGLLYQLSKKLSNDYNIYIARNGVEALKKLDEIAIIPDVIVTDVMMDEMDGLTFVQNIRGQKRFQHVPIIFASAITEEEKRLEGLKLGAVDFMAKPINFDELKLKIESILQIQEQHKRALMDHASASMKNSKTAITPKVISFQDRCKELNLTEREADAVKLIILGKTYKAAADLLHISEKTVSKHISNTYAKLGIKSKIELVNLFKGDQI